jgi:hypothetical protein
MMRGIEQKQMGKQGKAQAAAGVMVALRWKPLHSEIAWEMM